VGVAACLAAAAAVGWVVWRRRRAAPQQEPVAGADAEEGAVTGAAFSKSLAEPPAEKQPAFKSLDSFRVGEVSTADAGL
jgi:hypothetical protein